LKEGIFLEDFAMNHIKKILAAIDLSEYSLETLKSAAELAERVQAELIVVNVINRRDVETFKKIGSKIDNIGVQEFLQHRENDRHRQLRDLIQEASCGHLPVKVLVSTGIPFRELITIASDEGVDIVVMGAKGRTNLANVLFGSTAEKMFRHCPVPLLSIRHMAPDTRAEES